MEEFKSLFIRARAFIRTDFFLNVSILSLGTLIGQVFLVSISPILTRVYNPEHFGSFATFNSIVSILATFSTGKYEFALLLPSDDKEASYLLSLSAILSVVFGIFLAFISFFAFVFCNVDFLNQFNLNWLLLIPLTVTLCGITSSFIYWLQRKERYKTQSKYQLVYSLLNAILTLSFGFLGFLYGGLETAFFFTILITLILLYYYLSNDETLREDIQGLEFAKMITLGKRYINFPRFHILTQLCSNITQQITPLLFAVMYSSSTVGFYALANRILRLPVIVLSTAITSVFRNDAIKEIRAVGNCKSVFLTTLKRLVGLSLPIFAVLFVILPTTFSFVFGETWREAGVFARILCVAVFFDFIGIPVTQSIFIIKEKQKINLMLQGMGAVLTLIAIYMGYVFFKDVVISIIFLTISSIIYNIISILVSYRLASESVSKI